MLHNKMGIAELTGIHFERARKEFEHTIKLKPDYATAYKNLGVAYFDRKEYDKASEEFQRALQIDPGVFDRRSKAGVQAQMMTQGDRATFNFYLARLYAKAGSFDQ